MRLPPKNYTKLVLLLKAHATECNSVYWLICLIKAMALY